MPDAIVDAPDETDCEALAQGLHAAWVALPRPAALAAAVEQWLRGRCVLLALPRTADPAGPAWAFVLWSRHAAGEPFDAFALHGRRVDVRLQWRDGPQAAHWCHARLMKEHHPRHGRQLVPVDETGSGAAPACRVQLGPVVVASRRACEVCVRIDAVQRAWNALGTQWSVLVVVSPVPLAGTAPTHLEEPTC